jgi:hypothetical protein
MEQASDRPILAVQLNITQAKLQTGSEPLQSAPLLRKLWPLGVCMCRVFHLRPSYYRVEAEQQAC